jgi:glucose-6-phosphate-specific signal transduction histidine kinase
MPRPQKKEINFTKDSILSLMQEIYNELVEQRNTAIRIQNKMLSMLKDPEDMTTIGPVIEKQSFTLSDLDDDLLQNLIEKDVSSDEETYKIK